jgi:hypothetical protein
MYRGVLIYLFICVISTNEFDGENESNLVHFEFLLMLIALFYMNDDDDGDFHGDF